MKMLGSKRLLAKYIMPFVTSGIRGKTYWEPFAGGANTIPYLRSELRGISNVVLTDANPYLIALLEAARDGKLPFTETDCVSNEYYNAVKANPDAYPIAEVGFIAFCCSFGGKFFGGYARDKKTGRNYTAEGVRNLQKLSKHLQSVQLKVSSYSDDPCGLMDSEPSTHVVYCDPPYRGTTGYKTIQSGKISGMSFDSDKFWIWAQNLSRTQQVYVSEFQAPHGWECIWESSKRIHIDNNRSGMFKKERLYVYRAS